MKHVARSPLIAAMLLAAAAAGLLAAAPRGSDLINAVVYEPAKVSSLLDAGADPNAADSNGYTALMWAAEHNRVDAARLLIAHGADPARKDKNGRDAAYHARFYPDVLAVLRRASAAATANQVEPKATAAQARPQAKPAPEGGAVGKALINAALIGDVAKVGALLRDGADPNHRDSRGYTPLMRAAASNNPETVRLLLEAGADPNIRNENGFNALTYGRTNAQINRLLTAAGAQPAAPKATALPKPGQPNYCRAMYTRTYSLCGNSSSCKVVAADKWASCKKTGRWP